MKLIRIFLIIILIISSCTSYRYKPHRHIPLSEDHKKELHKRQLIAAIKVSFVVIVLPTAFIIYSLEK